MKATFVRSYRKQETGNIVNVYAVSGSKAELEVFAETQGDNHVVDEKLNKPLWFSTRFVGDSVPLIITKNGKVVADTSEFDKAASLCEQYKGTALGTEMAKIMAERLLGNGSHSTPVQAPVQQPAEEDEE